VVTGLLIALTPAFTTYFLGDLPVAINLITGQNLLNRHLKINKKVIETNQVNRN